MFANQQYNQQATAVSTGGMLWNGTAWVAQGGAPPAAAPAPVPAAVFETPAALITKYTQYYHQWTARMKEHEQHVSRLPVMSKERAEAQRHVDWSKYYADQASRAAHHYHSNPNVPVPFDVPPAPPTAAAGQQPQQLPQQQQHPAAAASSSSSDGGPPDSLKRYVHRCLEQCITPLQKEAAQRETEQAIASALQKGTLHSTNWDTVPLVTVPGLATRNVHINHQYTAHQQQQQQPSYQQASKKQKMSMDNSGSYYGHHQQQHQSSSGGGGGYYGPASASQPSPTTSSTTNSFYQSQQQQQQQHNGKYGGSWQQQQEANPDFIAVPSFGKNKKGKNNNKYVNPNSIKNKATKKNQNDGFQRTSKTMFQRANRFSGPGGNADVRQTSAQGIDGRYMGKGVIGGSQKVLDEHDYEHMKVKGTCRKLEKQYLRLTAPPKPELVRPLEILQLHLVKLKAEWERGDGKRRDYLWFCAEMKAMRQDLTVQHISNAFTVTCYETHARMALQEGDLNEFNQAQTQLKILYDKLRGGGNDAKALENENEFVAYRMIYFVMLTLNQTYSGGSGDLLNLMLSLTASQQKDRAIEHALKVRGAVAEVDYHKFFRLNEACPNLGDKLMDLMVPTVRHLSLQRICRAYRPVAEVSYVLQEIGLLPAASAKGLEDGKQFLLSCGCVLSDDGSEIMTKESTVRESDWQEKRSLI